MAPSHLRLRLAGPALIVACAVVAPASAAQWRSPAYPRTSGSAAMTLSQPLGGFGMNFQGTAIATNGAGRASILYRAANRGIYRVSRTTATGAWSSGAQWLSSSAAGVGTQLSATVSGSSIAALWSRTSPTGRISTVTGSWTSASPSRVRSSSIPGNFAPQQLTVGRVSGSTVFFGASYSSVMQGGDAFGGTSRAGAAPPFAAAASALPGSGIDGSTTMEIDSDSRGNLVALIANSGFSASTSGLTLATRAVGAATWTTAPVSPASVVGGSYGGGIQLAVDSDTAGNAAIAYVTWVTSAGVPTPSPVGNKLGIAVSQRIGATGTFGAAQVVQVLPDGPPALVAGELPLLQVPAMSVAVGFGTVALSFVTTAPGTGFTAWTSRTTLGQPLPAPSTQVSPNAVQEAQNGWGEGVQMQSAINQQGTVAVVFGGGMSNGATDGLWSTTSTAPGRWTPLQEIARCRNASGGYGGMDLAPYGTGFIASWACVAAGQFGIRAGLLGTATYR